MPKSATIIVNPKVLKWARKTAHLGTDDIPKSVIDPEILQKIESGKILPTLSQLQKLSKRYDRSLYKLLSDDIPEDDYFTLPFFRKEKRTNYDSPLALFIRDIQKKQDWARNYLLELGHGELNFIGSVTLKDSPKNVSKYIKKHLELPDFSKFNYSERGNFLKAIKESLEDSNIFVSIAGSDRSNRSIDLEQAQGFAISDSYAPFIFVNTKNQINAQIFTVIHELVHLFLNESGISEDAIRFRKPRCKEDKIENFCNEVAAEILMPEGVFEQKYKNTSGDLQNKITVLSRFFLVSELAVCVRLWKLKFIGYQVYTSTYITIRRAIEEYLVRKREKSKEKRQGGDYYLNMRSKNGLLLSRLALSAYQEQQMLPTDLSNLLKVKIHNFENYFALI